jgi:FkbM family methyltransferase
MVQNEWLRGFGRWLRDHIPIGGRLSYAQEGEDLVLARILGSNSSSGFFVDVGAHHPTRLSNTYYFYRRGWRGINVDALPGTASLFQRMRPRDVTVECGVGVKAGVMTYFVFNEPALNTFSEHEAHKKDRYPYHIVTTLQIPVMTLTEILDKHLPIGMAIDFMTIDAEGFDHEIVCSNDWNRYRPRVVLVELLNAGIENLASHPTAQLLHQQGYRSFAKTFNTVFFVHNEAYAESA